MKRPGVQVFATDGTSGLVYGTDGTNRDSLGVVNGYFGHSLLNTSTTQPEMLVIRERTATGKILDIIELDPRESRSDWYGERGLEFRAGIFLEYVLVGGIVAGSIRIG